MFLSTFDRPTGTYLYYMSNMMVGKPLSRSHWLRHINPFMTDINARVLCLVTFYRLAAILRVINLSYTFLFHPLFLCCRCTFKKKEFLKLIPNYAQSMSLFQPLRLSVLQHVFATPLAFHHANSSRCILNIGLQIGRKHPQSRYFLNH